MLLVLQGMDTSGKGGVLRHTVGLVDPQGVRITSFKAPTEEERAHDFLWRIRSGGARARLHRVFDRSHYEDVLIARVRELARPEEIERRYDAINDFERELVDGGTTVIKCMLHISAEEQKERLLARLDDPTKHWKYNPGDIDERALGALPRGLRDRAGADQHRARALARDPQRQEVVPEPGHRPAAARGAHGDGPAVAGGRLRRGGGAQAASRRGPHLVIPTVSVTRYVTPLREGGSLPGIVEADDLGTYVCKFRGAGQGVRVLVAEVIVGELARRIGLLTPRLVALDLDPEIARYEADEEVQDLLNASPGLNLGVDFLPGAFGFDGDLPLVDGPGVRDEAAGVSRRDGALAGCLHRERRPVLAQPQPAVLARRPVGDRPRRLAVLPPRLARWRHRSRPASPPSPGTPPTTCWAPTPRPFRPPTTRSAAALDADVFEEVLAEVPTSGWSPSPAPRPPTPCGRRTSPS